MIKKRVFLLSENVCQINKNIRSLYELLQKNLTLKMAFLLFV
ncbi:hypothetical protein US8_02260 [Bacillus altitudinis]|nr:hypothetical protein US8_02260 [Bacillus altitudinis]